MASLCLFATLLTIFISLQKTAATFFYPNPQASQLEHILVDVYGAYASNFSSAITPCTNYVSGSQNFGRETAAQWLRVAFHDFVTADVKTGTGGMDASIGFETLREEDSGSAFNDSLAFFRPFVTKDVSMADLIALSVSMSVGNCGGPQIPVRGGRIDATEAGAFGVPAPETDLNLTLAYFEGAGFDQVDSIGLTACGHTLGSVHHGGFPTVVGPEAVTSNNTAGGIHFDETVDVFDIKVVNEYLDGSGNAGGPLVTSFNESSRSDLRLYESDGNRTMIQLAAQGEEGFLNTCVDLLQRMVETVPAGVSLSGVVEPVGVKPVNVSLDFDDSGNLVLSGYLRILTPTTTTSPTTLTLTYSINTSTNTTTTQSQTLQLTAEPSTGTSTFGTTTYFPFTLAISTPSTSITLTTQSQTFTIQSQTFILSSLSTLSATKTSTNITIASLSSYSESAPEVKISVPLPQDGTLSPRIVEFSGDDVVLGKGEDISGYEIWDGNVQFGDVSTGGITVEVFEGGEVRDVVVLY